MARKMTERNRVLGYFVKEELKTAEETLKDAQLIVRSRQEPKPAKRGRKAKAEPPADIAF